MAGYLSLVQRLEDYVVALENDTLVSMAEWAVHQRVAQDLRAIINQSLPK